jgi:tetratricopeptide (TPR) repeat protein
MVSGIELSAFAGRIFPSPTPRLFAKTNVVFGLALAGLLLSGQASADCAPLVGNFVDIHGEVETQIEDGGAWSDATLETVLCEGSSIRVGAQSRAAVTLINDAVLRLDENTTMRLVDITEEEEERSFLDIIKGALHSFSRKPKKLSINSPYLNGSIEGTEFVFRVTDEQSEITVFEGTVVASNDQGSVPVSGGEAASASEGEAPQARTVVQPRDAAQWSLFYPPVFATGGEQATDVSSSLRQAAADLAAGRVDQARPKLDRAIAADTDAGLAYALRAVINVVQNQLEAALADANQAITLSPDGAAAHVALSYAQQANFQINAARDTLLRAVDKQPEDALAWARLAELQLMLGDKRRAIDAANKAVSLAPELGRTQITLGFAALAEFRAAEAQDAFVKAIMLDSADPLPHLGLGLARISSGELEQGRRDIEVAVGLGSNDALLRAYLGKAYFEEKRAPLDSRQFKIAKLLDPNDPTAWLYDGIAMQTQNRPVEAARDLEQSIELNDNRATYRGRLLLDKDRAARGTSLARAYKDMGIEQPAVNESTKSLTTDPANASAHRFLSDTHRGVRRLEQSRTSELFQAQMLQDININPVQPSISSTSLNITTLGGASNPGFNEFTPLFQQNQTRFDASAVSGENDTRGAEAVVTTVQDRFSLSLGGFQYETDGYRDNNELEHSIANIFGQADVSDDVNLQFEISSRESDSGDLVQNFDPDDFNPQLDRHFEADVFRLGARFGDGTASTTLVSLVYSDRKEEIDLGTTIPISGLPCFVLISQVPVPPPWPCPATFTVNENRKDFADRETWQAEGQHIYQGESFNVLSGIGYSTADLELSTKVTATITDDLTGLPVPIDPPEFSVNPSIVETEQNADIKDSRLYVYGNVETDYDVTWTLGLSYEDYENEGLDFDEVNPKLGLQWQLNSALVFRAALLKYVAPALANNRTLEPTQVAGFNQSFDDASATISEQIAAALDWRPHRDVYAGVSMSRRDLESPAFIGVPDSLSEAVFEDQEERHHRIYVSWSPDSHWVLGVEAVYDRFKTDDPSVDTALPLEVKTKSYPVTLRYFHPSGFFGYLGSTYVDQEYTDQVDSESGDDSFTVTDLSVGYRLPKRRGVVSITVQNVTDEEFNYQDDSYRTFEDEPSSGPYLPDRLVMGRLTLNF